MIAYVIVGAIFATLVFVTSVVAIPLMLNRNTDAITAALTSVRVSCLPGTLALWGATIAIDTRRHAARLHRPHPGWPLARHLACVRGAGACEGEAIAAPQIARRWW